MSRQSEIFFVFLVYSKAFHQSHAPSFFGTFAGKCRPSRVLINGYDDASVVESNAYVHDEPTSTETSFVEDLIENLAGSLHEEGNRFHKPSLHDSRKHDMSLFINIIENRISLEEDMLFISPPIRGWYSENPAWYNCALELDLFPFIVDRYMEHAKPAGTGADEMSRKLKEELFWYQKMIEHISRATSLCNGLVNLSDIWNPDWYRPIYAHDE